MSVVKALTSFAEDVSLKAKKNLKRKKASGDLAKIEYTVKEFPNSFQLSFYLQDYWEYVDQGVKGIGGTRADGRRWKRKKVTSRSKFSYKTGIENKPSPKHFDKWTIRKGLAPRTSGGQFRKRKGLSHAIAQTVWHEGLETTYFFSAPFEKAFKQLPDDLAEAYGLEVEELLISTT